MRDLKVCCGVEGFRHFQFFRGFGYLRVCFKAPRVLGFFGVGFLGCGVWGFRGKKITGVKRKRWGKSEIKTKCRTKCRTKVADAK